LPGAAAGTLEPRHVVTPLRDILRRTNLRLGAVTGHDPEARTVELQAQGGGAETIRYDQFIVALGSVSRSLPIPGLEGPIFTIDIRHARTINPIRCQILFRHQKE
jgi:NADH dehydrogenase